MENEKCCCGETLEIIKKSDKDEPEESKEVGCCESVDESLIDEQEVDNGCGCDSSGNELSQTPKESDGCGCGCGDEHPDQSLVENPDKPEFIAADEFIKEFEKYAHSLGIKAIGYTQLTPELLIQNKFIQYPNAIVLTMEMSKELVETAPGPKHRK